MISLVPSILLPIGCVPNNSAIDFEKVIGALVLIKPEAMVAPELAVILRDVVSLLEALKNEIDELLAS